MVAICSNANCGTPIPDDHSLPWCTACGEQLPESIQLRLTKLQEGRRKADAARAALGSEPQVEEICAQCCTHFMASSKLDFLGFRELTCPNCHLRSITPLKKSYRITYWVFLSLWVLALFQIFRDKGVRLDLEVAAIGLWLSHLFPAVLKDLRILYQQWIHRQQSSQGV